jgi:hypothetical protein
MILSLGIYRLRAQPFPASGSANGQGCEHALWHHHGVQDVGAAVWHLLATGCSPTGLGVGSAKRGAAVSTGQSISKFL